MTLYRFVDTLHTETRISLQCHEYEVIKETECGVWIRIGYDAKRFVNLNAHKKFACKTKEEALESFRARKQRQIRILSAQIDRAKAALTAEPDEYTYINWR